MLRLKVVVKFGWVNELQFVKCSRGEAWLEASHMSQNNEDTSTMQEEEDLEPVFAKHVSKL